MNAAEQNGILVLQAAVVQKASEDAAYRAALLADPKAAVEQFAGAALPGDYRIQVLEAPANTTIVALPYQAKAGQAGELSDADLENVAGGSKSGANHFFNTVFSPVGNAAISAFGHGALASMLANKSGGFTGANALIGGSSRC